MRTAANQVAFEAIVSILDAARPVTLSIGETEVKVEVSRGSSEPWPETGIAGVKSQAALPAPVVATCTWAGGRATLLIDLLRSRARGYQGDACLLVAVDGRWVLVSNVKAAVGEVADGDTTLIVARAALVKRGSAAGEQRELNRALRKIVAGTTLKMQSKATAVIAEVNVPGGTIAGGAAAAFEHAVLLALCKLEFIDPQGAAARGAPLLDFDRLELSEAARLALAGDHGDGDDDDVEDEDEDRVQRIRRRLEKVIPDDAERCGALELLAHAVENAHDERPTGWSVNDLGNTLLLVTGRLAACRIKRGSIAISVMGPISAEVRAAVGAEEEENEAWKAIPGGLYLRFPIANAGKIPPITMVNAFAMTTTDS